MGRLAGGGRFEGMESGEDFAVKILKGGFCKGKILRGNFYPRITQRREPKPPYGEGGGSKN